MVVIAVAFSDFQGRVNDITSYIGDLDGDGEANEVPCLNDPNESLYYSSSNNHTVGVWLVGRDGAIAASGLWASDISTEDIEAVLP